MAKPRYSYDKEPLSKKQCENGLFGTNAQTVSGSTDTGDTYLCLPTGTYCPTQDNTIDPRIVTPTDDWKSLGSYSDYGCMESIKLGKHASSTVQSITIHSNFVASTLRNDIAILTLSQPIVSGIYTNINTICLPANGASTSYVGESCIVSGWGQTDFDVDDAPTNPQKQVNVGIVDYTTCRTSFANRGLLGSNVAYVSGPQWRNMRRRTDHEGRLFCKFIKRIHNKPISLFTIMQDGGSPLVCADSSGIYSVAGLVIWGKNCGRAGVYGVYVSVPYYYSWIQGFL
ncbi:hypothetical protein NQ317_003821 [Molorchus minor]|uniref:Peptidase S1 domain-containing protein n=1 Tax=Molorchus minor TaxID=1323400 RepID=A0ABQ9IS03_9CUCU|nr:hypothetical protein NQ317_003821 [Molorchus minor]